MEPLSAGAVDLPVLLIDVGMTAGGVEKQGGSLT